jgi:hypothetical protein
VVRERTKGKQRKKKMRTGYGGGRGDDHTKRRGKGEKANSLPPFSERAVERQWKSLTGRWKVAEERFFSREREELFCEHVVFFTFPYFYFGNA